MVLGILQYTKSTDGVFTRGSDGYRIVTTDTPIQHRGGVAVSTLCFFLAPGNFGMDCEDRVDRVVTRLALAARPVATVLWREIYLSFFKMDADNPNLDPRGKFSWEVLASAYTAAIAPRILLACSRVGLPNIQCNDFDSRFFTAMSRADVMVE